MNAFYCRENAAREAGGSRELQMKRASALGIEPGRGETTNTDSFYRFIKHVTVCSAYSNEI